MSNELFWLLSVGGVALVSAALLPSAMYLAPYIGAVDIPGDARRMHTRPTPRCGGLALFVAFWSVLFALGSLDRMLLPLLIGTALLFLVGLADDIFGLPALFKLSVQLLASAIVLWRSRGEVLALYLLAAVWLTLVTNAHNMIDGLDGLCASVIAAQSLGCAVLLIACRDATGALLALGCLGCCLGYLPYNVHPAHVFMGDEGAMFLGFLMGVLSHRAYTATGKISVALLLCFLPVCDLSIAVVRRILRGENPFRADRSHLHHLLCDCGWGQRRVCRAFFLVSLCAAAVAVWLALA